jgi:hypothetical protein
MLQLLPHGAGASTVQVMRMLSHIRAFNFVYADWHGEMQPPNLSLASLCFAGAAVLNSIRTSEAGEHMHEPDVVNIDLQDSHS